MIIFFPKQQVITTGRAGGLHQPPWGISHAEPIGSSNYPPLAVVALPPQMWQLSLSLPCVKGGGTACRDGGIVLSFFYMSTIPQSPWVTAPFTQGSLPLRRELGKAKAFGEPPALLVVFGVQLRKDTVKPRGMTVPF